MNNALYQRFTLPVCPGEWLIPHAQVCPSCWLTERHPHSRRQTAMAEVHGHVSDLKRVSQCEGESVSGWQRRRAGTRRLRLDDGYFCLFHFSPYQPTLQISHLQMQNTPIIDAVIKWCFNLACLWLERKQPIHLTNEVISAIGWPCSFSYGHYTVCEALSQLCWPCHERGWKSEWIS